jgi:hypothetical protein
MLNTETPSGRHPNLDGYAATDLVRAFTEDQVHAAQVVHAAAAQIARAVEAAAPRIAAGGRLIYAGAGTSGRLGLLDSVELWPTFSWPKDRVVALLAVMSVSAYELNTLNSIDYLEGQTIEISTKILDVEAFAVSDAQCRLARDELLRRPFLLLRRRRNQCWLPRQDLLARGPLLRCQEQ